MSGMTSDRRGFLKASGRAAGLALLGASGVLGGAAPRPAAAALARRRDAAERPRAAMIRAAMIGVGGRGQALMDWALAHPALEMAALCDVDARRLEAAARRVGERSGATGGEGPRRAADFRRLLDDPGIDAVIVATPHHWHAPIALRALAAGKHVYVEKPASHVFREGRLLADAARRSGRVFQHGTQMRSSEVTRAAGEVLASGLLGEIKMAKAWGVEPRGDHPAPVPDGPPPAGLDWGFWLGPAPERPFNANRFTQWNNYREYGNGEIGGDGIHDIDMACWGLGVTTHPVRVVAHGSRVHVRGESDYPDNMLVTYQYAGDKVLVYENRNFAPYKMHGWDNGNIFYGTKGYMVFSRRGYFQTYLGAGEEEGPGMKGGAGNEENVHHFIDCARNGKPASAGAEVAHLSCALVHLGEIAYRRGGVLHFDPEREAVEGDAEAQAMLSKRYREPWGCEEA